MARRLLVVGMVLLLAGSVQADLHMQWVHHLPARKTAWGSTQRMHLDSAYKPAVAAGRVYVGCEYNGALLAFDLKTGRELWRYNTDGPIRVAPVADDYGVYVASDDGRLHCLDHNGKFRWRFHAAMDKPDSDRKVLGHDRLISAWPAGARPTIEDGKLYCVFGYWPVDGVYVYCLDAETGKTVWTNNTSQFRPFNETRIHEGKLQVMGHHGSGVFDIDTGEKLVEKIVKPTPGPELPKTPGVKGTVRYRYQLDGHVFVCTNEGGLYCFGEKKVEPRTYRHDAPKVDSSPTQELLRLTQLAGTQDGYCLVGGLKDGALVEQLIRHTSFHVLAVERDADKANRLRREFDANGLFHTHRLNIVTGPAGTNDLPPYVASLVVSENDGAIDKRYRESLRPYGGVMVERNGGDWKVTKREGPLPGADDWPQEFHDGSNTLASRDKRVKAPLGLLWYGGQAAHARFYFDGMVDHQSGHGLNPQPVMAEIVEGRMILQGPGLLGAVDIYTGRVLWERPLPKMYTFGGSGGGLGKHSKKHPKPWAHEPAMKFEVTPPERCRASGFNFVSLPDGIYVAAARNLLRFDPKTGKQTAKWTVPIEGDLRFGGVRVAGDVIVTTLFRPQDVIDAQAGYDGNGGDWAGDRMRMSYLAAFDRHSGKPLWQRKATWGFINRSGFCLGGGKVFAVDLLTDKVHNKFIEAGRKLPTDQPPAIRVFDLKTGKPVWSYALDVYTRNIAYSAKHDMLLVPNRNLIEWRDGKWHNLAFDVRRGRTNKNAPGRMRGLRGKDGKVLWTVEESAYHTPHIIMDDLLIDRYGNPYDLRTGKRHVRTSALTGLPETWSFRKGGCNHLIACDGLVTWRTAFYDLAGGTGVMKLTGFDAGCAPTLIPAGGVLAIPNFGTHHKRNRMTAVGMVHRPGNALWTQYTSDKPTHTGAIQRVGINFGAIGDRRDEDGTMWLRVDARSRTAAVVEPRQDVQWFTHDPADTGSFVGGSGVLGAATVTIPTTVSPDSKAVLRDKTKRVYDVRLILVSPQSAAVKRQVTLQVEGRAITVALPASGGLVEHDMEALEVTGPLDIALPKDAASVGLAGVRLVARP